MFLGDIESAGWMCPRALKQHPEALYNTNSVKMCNLGRMACHYYTSKSLKTIKIPANQLPSLTWGEITVMASENPEWAGSVKINSLVS